MANANSTSKTRREISAVRPDGKIAIEKYFGTFTKDSLWYWASAGKTITSFLVGKAQEEKYLSIYDTTSKFLGIGWTNCTKLQEDKINIRNQITMTTGLDDGITDNHCTADSCLKFLTSSGSRWAYHNAPYTLLEKVLENATGTSVNNYTQLKLKSKTGINGLWITSGYDNVFYSKARAMARFGLLIQNNCVWLNDTLLYDKAYLNQMTNTSQNLNLSYGYLWWLNGKPSYMLPGTQFVFPGSYAPAAPTDMFAALGKNGQIISVAKSLGLVVIRIGNQLDAADVTPKLCNNIWEKLNAVMCISAGVNSTQGKEVRINIYPNPANTELNISMHNDEDFQVEIHDLLGETILKAANKPIIDLSNYKRGVYFITISQGSLKITQKFTKTL